MKKISYKNKITITLLISTLIPFIMISYIYINDVYKKTFESVISDFKVEFKVGVDNFNSILAKTEQTALFISNYGFLYNILTESSPIELLKSLENDKFLGDTFSALLSDGKVSEISVYTSNSNILKSKYIKNLEYLKEQPYYTDKILGNEDYWMYYHEDNKNIQGDYIILYKEYKTLDNNTNVLEIKVLMKNIMKYFQFENSEVICLFVNNDGQNVFLTPEEKLEKKFSSSKYYKLEENIALLNTKCDLYIPKSIIKNSTLIPIAVSVVISVIMIIILVMIINVIVKVLTKRLSSICENISKGGSEYRGDEFDIIANTFEEMALKMKAENERELELKKENINLELKLLQEKISPHFLYNTLSAIKWIYKDHKLGEIIDSMVKYYRVVLNRGNDYIELSKEKECLEEYLKLQMFSYGKNVEYEIDIQSGLEKVMILKHTLQPIVENAFLHGINPLPDNTGKIIVKARRKGDTLVLSVWDNGDGMSADTIQAILNGEKSKSVKGGSGYAIYNIQKRIKLCYGEKYGISIISDNGTLVQIIIPNPTI